MSVIPSQAPLATETDADNAIVNAAFGTGSLLTEYSPSQQLWGFGGLHGGLTLALLAQSMQKSVPTKQLVQISASFTKNIRHPFDIQTEIEHAGRTATHVKATAMANKQSLASATAVFSDPASHTAGKLVAPSMPDVPSPLICPPFHLPRSLVPFAGRTELRPAMDTRPLQKANSPVLTAWLRVKDDESAVDFFKLAFLMDALAPSYSAMLEEMVLIPTVTITMYPTNIQSATRSPWILLRAETQACTLDGWIDEQLHAWSEDGVFLGSASQRRFILAKN